MPADGRLLEDVDGLIVNESLLTGESMPVAKRAQTVHPDGTPLADRTNMVFAGTVVSEGAGLAVVTETGANSEVGQIRALIAQAAAPPTPLEITPRADGTDAGRGDHRAVRGRAGSGVASRRLLSRDGAHDDRARGGGGPEGLPTVATTTLALGMHRMLKRQALVRRLEVIESLGATTVVCVDKTGTLTENRMTVQGWALENGLFVADPGDGAEPKPAWGAARRP